MLIGLFTALDIRYSVVYFTYFMCCTAYVLKNCNLVDFIYSNMYTGYTNIVSYSPAPCIHMQLELTYGEGPLLKKHLSIIYSKKINKIKCFSYSNVFSYTMVTNVQNGCLIITSQNPHYCLFESPIFYPIWHLFSCTLLFLTTIIALYMLHVHF